MTDQVQATSREYEEQVRELTAGELEDVSGGFAPNVVYVGGSRSFVGETGGLIGIDFRP
jgi:lactobin A/cerein 7B family class IIb bacteriocin